MIYSVFRSACAAFCLAISPALWAAPDSNALAEQLARHAPDCGRFEQSRWLADLETQLDSQGYFHHQKDTLIWQTSAPIQDRVVLSKNNDDLPLGFQIIAPIFNGLLSGNWQKLEYHFEAELSGQLDDWQAQLLPRESAVAERLVQLTVSGSERVEQVALRFKNGDRLTLNLLAATCQSLDSSSS